MLNVLSSYVNNVIPVHVFIPQVHVREGSWMITEIVLWFIVSSLPPLIKIAHNHNASSIQRSLFNNNQLCVVLNVQKSSSDTWFVHIWRNVKPKWWLCVMFCRKFIVLCFMIVFEEWNGMCDVSIDCIYAKVPRIFHSLNWWYSF